ncbi:MAG: Alkaline phosphatase 4 precursor [Bacteroidetes bacterium ADurb.Bin139]|nr:MAG: Alkaline phosphatase 4 precursor [Bacteroidetes bacterium ADurb.Bin139]HOZ19985.1 alkaline phosphatase [Bacteroidales bacterium]HPB78365.1 alkaline phosphatase [Bacteroidales bacterium]HQN82125.1 alkaline phosphatase [Bacteroidales bacterium]HQP64528.1 alkaline phosphatase [Bacteroidales bacterium]
MKRLLTMLAVALLVGCQQSAPQAKYVFYFIGDGMGLAQVALAEAWLAHTEDEIGFEKLSFTEFPVFGTATTFSTYNFITCSSASGTALATGHKTVNGMLGVTPDTLDLEAITYKIKKAGYRVGITSTVTLDHATPGAFYANAASRSDYYDIAVQLPRTGFDFFGGGGFVQPEGKNKDQVSVLSLIEEGGYQIVYGIDNIEASAGAEKMVLLQEKERDCMGALPYAIDRKEDDMTHAALITAAIDFLENEKGFFLMSESGRIDWACHSNDGKTSILETLDLNEAVKVALEFAQKHPEETLIVVTADHETGGLALGLENGYSLYFDQLSGQNASKDMLLQSGDKEMAGQVAEMNNRARIGWTTFSHTGIPVPVYATGAGSEFFAGSMDNTDIPKKICRAMGIVF